MQAKMITEDSYHEEIQGETEEGDHGGKGQESRGRFPKEGSLKGPQKTPLPNCQY